MRKRRNTAPWLRIDVGVYQFPALRALRPWGAQVWIGVLMMTKMHGWGGLIPPGGVTGATVADHLGYGIEVVADIDRTIAGLVAAGLLRPRGAGYRIPDWKRFQPDPTGTERSERSRGDHKSKPTKSCETPATVASVGNDDVTGRDGTGRTDSESTSPSIQAPTLLDQPEPPRTTTHLSGGLAQRLALEGIRIRERPGEWWEWEKGVTAAVTARGIDAVVAWLKDPANAPRSVKSFLFDFSPAIEDGRRRFKDGPPAPKMSDAEAHALAARLYPKGTA